MLELLEKNGTSVALEMKDAQPSRAPCSGYLNISIQKFINLCDGSLQPPSIYRVRAYSCHVLHKVCVTPYTTGCASRERCVHPLLTGKKKVIQVGIVPGFNSEDDPQTVYCLLEQNLTC